MPERGTNPRAPGLQAGSFNHCTRSSAFPENIQEITKIQPGMVRLQEGYGRSRWHCILFPATLAQTLKQHWESVSCRLGDCGEDVPPVALSGKQWFIPYNDGH